MGYIVYMHVAIFNDMHVQVLCMYNVHVHGVYMYMYICRSHPMIRNCRKLNLRTLLQLPWTWRRRCVQVYIHNVHVNVLLYMYMYMYIHVHVYIQASKRDTHWGKQIQKPSYNSDSTTMWNPYMFQQKYYT